jgi:tetratricopeptide (TPR) repeat protein
MNPADPTDPELDQLASQIAASKIDMNHHRWHCPYPVCVACRAWEEDKRNYDRLAAAEDAAGWIVKLEQAYLAADVQPDDPRYSELWTEMGETYARLQRRRDAGLAFARALWDLDDGPAMAGVVSRWAWAMGLGNAAAVRASVGKLLAVTNPSRDDVYALAGCVIMGGNGYDAHAAQLWLDRHDENLDVRSLWLVRRALAHLVGGDRLGLARARDRVLARLHRGPSIERDVPTFLRFYGSRDTASVDRLVGELDGMLVRAIKGKRARSTIEAPLLQTQAYIELVFAYGAARLGRTDKARSLRDQALARLDVKDPIHSLLTRAYSARIDQALEKLAPETPLPAALAGEFNSLERFSRYKADRLRQASTILEPQERLDPVRGFQTGGKDPRGEEFTAMRSMPEGAELTQAVDALMVRALDGKTSVEDRARLFDGLMDFFPRVSEAQAVPHLETLTRSIADVPAPRRADLLEKALTLGGHFGRDEIIRVLLTALRQAIAELGPEHADKLAKALNSSLRTLRRVGLREEATDLLDRAAKTSGGAGAAQLDARIQLAGGLAYLGHMDRAEPIFAEAEKALEDAALTGPDRLKLARSFASAVTHAPQDFALAALGRLGGQLARVTDSFNTNSHFCLSVVSFMEALVLALAGEDLTPALERWLDEDEFLVRRRLHLGVSADAAKAPR